MDTERRIRAVFVGHLDHGKSSLIGRILQEVKGLGGSTELAHRTDHLAEEQERGMTIDAAEAFIRIDDLQLVLMDVPGHLELIHNMLTGSSRADVAILVVAADEDVCDQTRVHARLLKLLGLDHVVLVINKTELRDKDNVIQVEQNARALLNELGLDLAHAIPASAVEGWNIVENTPQPDWYHGPGLLEVIADSHQESAPLGIVRFIVQDLYEHDIHGPVSVGRIIAGSIHEGDILTLLPDDIITTVERICRFPDDRSPAYTGECVGLQLTEPAERGSIISSPDEDIRTCSQIQARVFMFHDSVIQEGDTLTLCSATWQRKIQIKKIQNVADGKTFKPQADKQLDFCAFGEVTLLADAPFCCEPNAPRSPLSRFTLQRHGHPIAAGMVILAN